MYPEEILISEMAAELEEVTVTQLFRVARRVEFAMITLAPKVPNVAPVPT
jgi:hypothetical protein